MKRIKGVLLAALLTVTVSMPVYADRSEKVELPQSAYCEAKRPDLRSKTVAFRF